MVSIENRNEAKEFTLRSTFNISGDSGWYTDDSVKLIKQEIYTVEDAKRLNITS